MPTHTKDFLACPRASQAFVMRNGARLHGVALSTLVKHGAAAGWECEVMDAAEMPGEEGDLLTFMFFSPVPEGGGVAGQAAAGEAGAGSLLNDLD